MEKYYTSEQVAEILNLKRGTVQKLVREGKLKAVRTGGARKMIRISESELQAYLKKQYK